jgi:hypothetical protein
VEWRLDMDSRGFPPQLIQVRKMADALLAARNPGQPFEKTGRCWANRFIKNEPKLVFKESTILSAFRATGLIPHNPSYVLSNLTVTKTPSPPGTSDGSISSPWPGGTPLNVSQLDRQSQHLKSLLQRSSNSPTNLAFKSLIKGCEMAMNSATILARENIELRAANAHKTRKAQQSNQYIAHGGVLQAQQGQFLVEQRQNGSQNGNGSRSDGSQIRGLRACGYCKIPGHNIRTCPAIITIDEEAIEQDLM